MFNFFFSNPTLLVWLILSFLLILTLRKLLFPRTIFAVLYHFSLFVVLFILSIGGGGTQNDGYERLEKFISLESNNQLQNAKNNLKEYDGMFQIDLEQFKDSSEFKDYLQSNDSFVDKVETLLIAWLLALIADLTMAFIGWLQRKNFARNHINKY